VEAPGKTVTARDLIRKKVEKEVADFNRNRHLMYGREFRIPEEMLEDEASASDPARHGTFTPIAWEAEADQALAAWGEGTFRITVDEENITTLDEKIALHPDMEIVFLRLMPFISG
jgi:hypothetical protein